jgi:hypothetical protein
MASIAGLEQQRQARAFENDQSHNLAPSLAVNSLLLQGHGAAAQLASLADSNSSS